MNIHYRLLQLSEDYEHQVTKRDLKNQIKGYSQLELCIYSENQQIVTKRLVTYIYFTYFYAFW